MAMIAHVVKAGRLWASETRSISSRYCRRISNQRKRQQTPASFTKPYKYAQQPPRPAHKLPQPSVLLAHESHAHGQLPADAGVGVRLGLGQYEVSSTDVRMRPKGVILWLERMLKGLSEEGLGLAFKVAHELAKWQPTVRITSQPRPVHSSPARDVSVSAKWLFTITGADDMHRNVFPLIINVSIPGMALRCKEIAGPMILDLFIYVRKRDRSSQPAMETAILPDLELLCHSACEISSRVCSELVFERKADVPAAISEGLLSLLSIASPIGEIGQVLARCVWRAGTSNEVTCLLGARRPVGQAKLILEGTGSDHRMYTEGEMQVSTMHGTKRIANSSREKLMDSSESHNSLYNAAGMTDEGEQDFPNIPLDIATRNANKQESSALGQLNTDVTGASLEPTNTPITMASKTAATGYGRVYIALGSNIGDRIEAIETACRTIDADPDMELLMVSPLYETEPMYVADQAPFLNGVCEIDTQLDPMELLDRLQAIEQNLGRVKLIDKGPRNIDLDILLYKDQWVQTERLTIPHALMLEREFVLRPLSHIFGLNIPLVPGSDARIADYLAQLDPQAMYTVTALSNDKLRLMKTTVPTLIMAILNTTPDSFSDGGENQPSDSFTLRETVAAQIAAGATIIDIGGQSSRPNAPDVTAEEEITRVVPVIEAIKSLTDAAGALISVDTYRASVAEAAVKAGAHIVNDISAGQLDPNMLPTVARLGCTYIMMHMRGTPATMQSPENCSYPHGLLATVRTALLDQVSAAEAAGIFPWRIILDPGIGFSKTKDQNLELLTGLSALRDDEVARNYAWLVGSSRKGFIGEITDTAVPKERVAGTGATVTAAIMGGADIIRVHDVAEMVQVAKMADAMYRTQ